MRSIRVIAIFTVGLLAATHPTSAQELGQRGSLESHQVSLEELWARPSFFDGQPVTIIGVADLGVGFEARPKIYSSREAFENATFQYISVSFSDEWIERYADALEGFTGKYVMLEGWFSHSPREKIDEGDEGLCFGDCASPGTLYDIHYIVVGD